MKKSRPKKYLLFMFGAWIRLEDNLELYEHIKDVLETILAVPELSFVTGEHTLIACIESHVSFKEIKELLEEFLKPSIPAYFLMPKPRNLSYRLNPLLEQHLFGRRNNKIKKMTPPPPEMIEELMEYFRRRALDNINGFKGEKVSLDFLKENYDPDKFFKNNEILDIDVILDKINDKGINSLTDNEKKFLDKQKK
jgi:hypothetical protein